MKTINDIRTNLNNTIDLAGQYENERYNWLVDNGYLPEPQSKKGAILMFVVTLICVIGIFMSDGRVNANYDDLTIQDKIRLERKDVCARIQREIRPELGTDDVNRCATVLTLNYAIESGFGKKEVRPNNKLGLKGYRDNGTYGFLTFKTEYEARIYWARSYYNYHYNKSMRTFIYGFKQKDGSWRWGYTATQKDMYYNFFMKRWNKIYGEIEALEFNIQ